MLHKIEIVCRALYSVVFIMLFLTHFMLSLSTPNIWLLCSTRCLLNCQLPTRRKWLRRSMWRWRGGKEPDSFPVVSLPARRQKGFALAVEGAVKPR